MQRSDGFHTFPSPGGHLCGLAWDGSHLWHSYGTANRIYRIDRSSGEVLGDIACDNVRTCLAFDGRFLWQIAGTPKRIRVIDPDGGRTMREIELPEDAESVCALTIDDHSYWLGSKTTGIVQRRDRTTHAVMRTLQTQGSVHGLAIAGNVLWYTDYPASALVAMEINSQREFFRRELPGHPTGLCSDGERLWYCDYTHQAIVALDLRASE